jgi:hypothetical protein
MEGFEIKDILGMPADAVLYGLFGGLIMLARAEKTTRFKAFATVLSGMVIAGTGADLLQDLVVYRFELFTHTSAKNVRIAAALFLGACWQNSVHIAISKIGRWRV